MRALTILVILEAVAIVTLGAVLWTRDSGTPPIEGETDEAASESGGWASAPETASNAPPPEATPPVEAADPKPKVEDRPPATDDSPASKTVGLVMFGSIRSKGSAPVEGALISMSLKDDPKKRRYMRVQEASTYSLGGLTPGTWKLSVRAENYKPYDEEVELQPGPVTRRKDLLIEPSILVKVVLLTPDGVPLHEVKSMSSLILSRSLSVVATAEEPPVVVHGSVSRRAPVESLAKWNENGGFPRQKKMLPKRYFGQLDLQQPPPLFVSVYNGPVRLAMTTLGAGKDELTIEISLDELQASVGGVSFRLVDAATNEPIAKAGIYMSNSYFSRVPDERGTVKIEGRTAGKHRLSIMKDGYERYGSNVVVEPGQQLDLGVIRLRKETPGWGGTVVDAGGQPFAAMLRSLRLDAGKVMGSGPGGRADRKGQFTLKGVGPHRYLLIASKNRDKEMAWMVFDARREPSPIALRMRPAVRLRIENGLRGFRGVDVVVRTAAGHPIWSRHLTARSRLGPLLPPGNYTVAIRDTGESGGTTRHVPLAVTKKGGTIIVP